MEERCRRWRAALIADADTDGGGAPVERRLLDRHLAECPDCRLVAATASGAGGADEGGDPTLIARRVAAADRAETPLVLRGLLAVIAAELVAFALPELLTGGSGEALHEGRHLGAFTVAYAVALGAVVVRPARARAVLPIAAVAAGGLALGAIVDLASGRVPVIAEIRHLPEVFSVAIVWSIAMRRPRRWFVQPGTAMITSPATDVKSVTRTRTSNSHSPG